MSLDIRGASTSMPYLPYCLQTAIMILQTIHRDRRFVVPNPVRINSGNAKDMIPKRVKPSDLGAVIHTTRNDSRLIRGFKGICCRYNIIIDALVDTTAGNTPSRMVERLEKNDIHVNERTICRWMDNYSELIETHTKNIKFQTSGQWRDCARLLVDCH